MSLLLMFMSILTLLVLYIVFTFFVIGLVHSSLLTISHHNVLKPFHLNDVYIAEIPAVV